MRTNVIHANVHIPLMPYFYGLMLSANLNLVIMKVSNYLEKNFEWKIVVIKEI